MNTSTGENARKEDVPPVKEPVQADPVTDGDTALPENGDGPSSNGSAQVGGAHPLDPEGPHEDDHLDSADQEYADQEYADAAAPAPKPGGTFSAETFAVAAILLTGLAMIGTRMGQLLASITADPADQVSSIANVILGDAGTALLGVLLGGVSLILSNSATHRWAKWVATAAIIVGVVAVAAGGAAFLLLPEPQPMQMQPGM
ncbi:hypothetical protein CLV63_111106 [Murinocardiopsis flavida]|uniref:Uncharacterized protein n=1 Tax=Murinocardiopsis flavida TaxID=645275 RepID=A0A2P8DH24_9ACTN|nr:hypothetical protein [Murinocardiopsis flavida]PSK96511.1 hypothetical protein CLV63_111106 [Murinocardiopsis flavida]